MENMSELKILCLGGDCRSRYGVRVFSQDGTCVYEGTLKNGEADFVSVLPGEYTLRLGSHGCMQPRGYTRWVTAEPGGSYAVFGLFRRPVNPIRRVSFTVEDANYPGIVPMNGGITVWQSKTM